MYPVPPFLLSHDGFTLLPLTIGGGGAIEDILLLMCPYVWVAQPKVTSWSDVISQSKYVPPLPQNRVPGDRELTARPRTSSGLFKLKQIPSPTFQD